jgi:hypothetical protein
MAAYLESSESPSRTTPPEQLLDAEVHEALSRILESRPFSTSKQCKALLRYVVEHSLSHDDSGLRERIIGTAVFGRSPSYDTNEDPVVRMRAADVRKRLAQYYLALDPKEQAVRIDLQPGSYKARFINDHPAQLPAKLSASAQTGDFPIFPEHPVEVHAIAFPKNALERHGRWHAFLHSWKLVILLIILGAVAALPYFVLTSARVGPQQRFWAPLIKTDQPVLIYLGANAAYRFTPEFLARYRAATGIPNTGPEIFVDLPPGGAVKTEDLLPVKDTFIAGTDAIALVELAMQMRDWNKSFMVRSGDDLSMGDLRDRPLITIGAFNNKWTLLINKDLPFQFHDSLRVESRDHPDLGWSVAYGSGSSTTDDYALITRVLSSRIGGPALTVAGVSEYGTRAAAEFLTSPAKMRDLLKNAPKGWEHENMQIVLHVKVLDAQPVSVQVVATQYW